MDTALINDKTLIHRNADIITSNVSGEVLMINLKSGFYFALNSTASQIWDLIESEISVKELCARIMRLYEVDEVRCTTSVIKCLTKMRNQGLVIAQEPVGVQNG